MGGPGSYTGSDGKRHDAHELDNFACDYPVEIDGILYTCAEAAYQACKYKDVATGGYTRPEVIERLSAPLSSFEARILDSPARDDILGNQFWHEGQRPTGLRADWLAVKVYAMYTVNAAKLARHPETVGAALEATGSSKIWFAHTFSEWGTPPGAAERGEVCENWNGRIFMLLRELQRPEDRQDKMLIAAVFTAMRDKCSAALPRLAPAGRPGAEELLSKLDAEIARFGGRAEHPSV